MQLRKRLKAILVVSVMLLATLIVPVLAAGEDVAAVSRFYNTAWAFLPPVIAILLALITKEAYSSLFIGIVVGAVLHCEFAPVATLDAVINDGLITAIADNAGIFLFLVILGTIVALVYMILAYLFRFDGGKALSRDTPDPAGSILRDILRIAIPITLSSSMVGIVTVIDSSLVQGQLQRVLLENRDSWGIYAGMLDFSALEEAITAWTATLPDGTAATLALLTQQMEAKQPAEEAAALLAALEAASRTLFGNYGGALTIYNLPTSLMAAITASVIPAVSGALARRDRIGGAKITGSALRITALLAFPMGVGLFVLGRPIMRLLFSWPARCCPPWDWPPCLCV